MGSETPVAGLHVLTEIEIGLHDAALAALQALASAEVEAVVYRRGNTLFVEARPGHEVRLLTELSLADWGLMVRAVEHR